jgi:hypothetical protein
MEAPRKKKPLMDELMNNDDLNEQCEACGNASADCECTVNERDDDPEIPKTEWT